MSERNDVLARAISGEEVTAAQAVEGNEARFDVPDFDAGVKMYTDGTGSVEESILGNGTYRSIWNREKLAKVLSMAGWDIVGGVHGTNWSDGNGWISVVARRVSRPTPKLPMADVYAIMSLPRIAWTENFASVTRVCTRLGIDFAKATGVFWGQCMQRVMEKAIDEPKNKYVMSIDYDSVFDENDVIRLWQIMETRPEIDALFPLQIQREKERVLLTMVNQDGKRIERVDAAIFRQEAIECETGHFGLSFFRATALRRMAKPWFLPTPCEDGTWGDGRIDDDIHFWKQWAQCGNRCYVTPRVRIGHLQLKITWPGEDLRTIHQYCTEYNGDGRPSECTTY
jgi:hypothetical protein